LLLLQGTKFPARGVLDITSSILIRTRQVAENEARTAPIPEVSAGNAEGVVEVKWVEADAVFSSGLFQQD
jgi:hypothetical protein